MPWAYAVLARTGLTFVSYLDIKAVHIIGMVLLFGTGLGSAFYKWMADRSECVEHIAMTNRHVVIADWLFTTPAIVLQPITGLWMVSLLKLPLQSTWIIASIVFYALAGACWIPVVYLQIRMKKTSQIAMRNGMALPECYWRDARRWVWLGVPAFVSMLVIVMLMVFKYI